MLKTESMLWLAVQLPHLALDLCTRGQSRGQQQPVAVIDDDSPKPRVLDCTAGAARHGITPNMPTGAALALAADVLMVPRDIRAEQAALERLATCCYRYSSQVSLCHTTAEILLEISRSQRLFGSTNRIAQELQQLFRALGYHVRTGSAPTPEAARLAATHGLDITPTDSLGAQIGHLPVSSLDLDARQAQALASMGFRSIREVLRLPRKALARRQGMRVVNYLERLIGTRPDPRHPWHPPDDFSSTLQLTEEVSSSPALLFPLRRLVTELCSVLRGRDCGIQQLNFELLHDQGSLHIQLGMQHPGRDEDRILMLLRERLERTRLPRPIQRITLQAPQMLPFDAHQAGLLPDGDGHELSTISPLLDRLQARLGQDAVVGLCGVADHRPERSWSFRRPEQPADCTALPHRPTWLLSQPQPCQIDDYQLLAGPERIETGWWDGQDCRRDYFIARDTGGQLLWAFREYKPHPGWYLQGFFA